MRGGHRTGHHPQTAARPRPPAASAGSATGTAHTMTDAVTLSDDVMPNAGEVIALPASGSSRRPTADTQTETEWPRELRWVPLDARSLKRELHELGRGRGVNSPDLPDRLGTALRSFLEWQLAERESDERLHGHPVSSVSFWSSCWRRSPPTCRRI